MKILLSLVFFLFSFSVSAATLESNNASGMTVSGGTGIVVFQDIQVPINESTGTRGDGKIPAQEFQNHAGLALQGGMGYRLTTGNWQHNLSLNMMQARATTGPAATQSSSYSRLSTMLTSDYAFSFGLAGAHMGWRRSSFNNVSTGHFVDSLLIGGQVRFLPTSSWQFHIAASVAPISGFYYNPGKGFRGNKFESGETQVGSYSVESLHNLHADTWLQLGLEQELAKVTVADVSEYDTFGLNVTPTAQSSRLYNLATTVLSIGFVKKF